MIRKEASMLNDRAQVKVTFTLPASIWAEKIYLVGDYNGWNRRSHPMQRARSGQWTATVFLEPNRAYQFRYLIDNVNWTNDDNADAYVRNLHGSDNFVVFTDPRFEKYCGD